MYTHKLTQEICIHTVVVRRKWLGRGWVGVGGGLEGRGEEVVVGD